MADAPLQLLIDLRAARAPRQVWSRPLLGLTPVDRAVCAAQRTGIDTIGLLVDPDTDVDAARSGVIVWTPEDLGNGFAAPTIYMTGVVLVEPSWLGAAVSAPVPPGDSRGLAPGAALCGVGVTLGDAGAAAETGGEMDILSLGDGNWRDAEGRLLQSLRKSTDGFMARIFARPISLALSRRLARTGVTPNMMTVVSLLIGLLAAPFFLSDVWWVQTVGGLLFVAHSVIDGCDGELARLKFIESRFGGLLDFWSDNIVHVAVFACMGLGWAWAEAAAWPLWLAAPAVLGTVGSAVAVYWLTMRGRSGAGPVYTSVAAGEGSRLTRLLDELSRRDFIYLVFALSLFGRAAWFLVPAAVGAPAFFLLVLAAAWRSRRQAAV